MKPLADTAQLVKAVCAPSELCPGFGDRSLHTLPCHPNRRNALHHHRGAVEIVPDDAKKRADFLRRQVHRQSLDDKKHRAPGLDLSCPRAVERGTSDRRNAPGFSKQLIAQFDHFRQIKVIPAQSAVIHTVHSRIQSAGDIHHRTVGIFRNEIPHQFVKNNGPRQNAAAHGAVFRRFGKIIIDFPDDFDRFGVIKLMLWAKRILRSGIKALQHGLRCIGKICFYFFVHSTTTPFTIQQWLGIICGQYPAAPIPGLPDRRSICITGSFGVKAVCFPAKSLIYRSFFTLGSRTFRAFSSVSSDSS